MEKLQLEFVYFISWMGIRSTFDVSMLTLELVHLQPHIQSKMVYRFHWIVERLGIAVRRLVAV